MNMQLNHAIVQRYNIYFIDKGKYNYRINNSDTHLYGNIGMYYLLTHSNDLYTSNGAMSLTGTVNASRE